eukprot:CAMPEP_0115185516 /NCGR_PEP_ID=MMETSP0270-20121206/9512_1 /TAXON_ID=71861 /ORGANISM="Scrippsiella trochoidea, Strain CCMP3099" /LENGTH=242 /DNA_ID=CAMNT_0002598623 /DNA_START=771 /DNA_END=1494 /DNA_ORIENTATION=-
MYEVASATASATTASAMAKLLSPRDPASSSASALALAFPTRQARASAASLRTRTTGSAKPEHNAFAAPVTRAPRSPTAAAATAVKATRAAQRTTTSSSRNLERARASGRPSLEGVVKQGKACKAERRTSTFLCPRQDLKQVKDLIAPFAAQFDKHVYRCHPHIDICVPQASTDQCDRALAAVGGDVAEGDYSAAADTRLGVAHVRNQHADCPWVTSIRKLTECLQRRSADSWESVHQPSADR